MTLTTCGAIGVAAFAVGVIAGQHPLSPERDDSHLVRDLMRLETKVDDLVRAISTSAEPRSTDVLAASPPVVVRSDAAKSPEYDADDVYRMTVDMLRELQAVRDEVRGWLQDFDATGVRFHEAVRRNGSPKWDEIAAFGFGGEEEGWRERALKEVYLMTPVEIIQRFGAPSGINADGWYWVRRDAELRPGEVRELDIGLSQGLVVGVGVNCE